MSFKYRSTIIGMFMTAFVIGIFSAAPVLALEDGIIAVVDSDVITAKDLQDYLRSIYAQLRIEGRSPKDIKEIMDEYQSKGVGQLIEDKLILAEANRQSMQIRLKAVDERMDEIKAKYPATQDFLAEINKEGVTISDIRKKIENQLKARYIVTQEVRDKITVNPQDVTDFYNAHLQDYSRSARVYLQSIFIKADAGNDEAMLKMRSALEKLRSGTDFKTVAKIYSEMPDIGEVFDSSLSPEFKAKVDTMSVGNVTDILRVPEGLYILKLTGRTAGVTPTLQELKEDIYQKVFEIKFKEAFSAWIEKLRKKAYVEIK